MLFDDVASVWDRPSCDSKSKTSRTINSHRRLIYSIDTNLKQVDEINHEDEEATPNIKSNHTRRKYLK